MRLAPGLLGRGRLSAVTMAAAATVLVAAVAVAPKFRHRTFTEQLADLAPKRAISPLTSLRVEYRPCNATGSDSTIAGVLCPGDHSVDRRELERLVADIQRRIDDGIDEEAVRAQAMIEMHGLRGGRPDAGQAIAYLDSALPITHDSAGVLADLTAAYVVLAGEGGSYVDLIQALDYSKQALELKPRLLTALFNRALALRLLTADRAASDAWRHYAVASAPTGVWAWLPDRDAPWRHEAERAAREFAHAHRAEAPMSPEASVAELTAFGRSHPQEAREAGWNVLLPAWGRAVLADDSARAEMHLRQAEILGAALAGVKGDGSLAEQVRHLRALPRSGAALRQAADAHRLDGELYEARLGMNDLNSAAVLDSLRAHPLFPSHRVWVDVRRNSTLIDAGRNDEAEHLLDSLQSTIDPLRYPAAAAHLDQNRATLLTRKGDFGKAPALYLKAEHEFAHIGEELNRGAMGAYISDTERAAGNPGKADEWMMRASVRLRGFGATKLRHDLLRQASNVALRNQFQRAMLDLAQEDVEVAREYGKPPFMAEARANYAVLLAAGGDEAGTLRELANVDSIVSTLTPAIQRFFAAYRSYALGLLRVRNRPQAVLALADTLVADQSRAVWPMRGYALRARALVALGDTAGARQAIDAEFEVLERARTGLRGGAGERDIAEGDVREAVRRLAQRFAAAGRHRDALLYLDRAEAAYSPVQPDDRPLPERVPGERVVVRPLLAGDTLLVWTLAGPRVSLTRTTVPAQRLAATIDSLKSSFANRWNADAQLAALYAMLIAPIEREMGPDGTELVFVTDPDLAWLPMDALLGPGGRPLLRRHPVSRALSVASAAAPREEAPPVSGVFLAPVYGPGAGLDPLPRARAEVDSIAGFYDAPRVLAPRLGALDFAMELAGSSLVHFAGHAVVDDLHPERSYLALGATRLEAKGIETLQLDSVRLVVLSACSSLTGNRGTAGFAGLSGAFLGAGAHGLVGSLWKVDDDATLALMTEFHREYLKTHDPARALRTAKLKLLASGDAVFRSPSTWAAFQLVRR